MALAVCRSVVGASTSGRHSGAQFCPKLGSKPSEFAFDRDDCRILSSAAIASAKGFNSKSRCLRKSSRRSNFLASSAAGEGNDHGKSTSDSGDGGEEAFEVKDSLEGVLRNEESSRMLDRLADRVLKGEESEALLKDFAAAAGRVARAKEELHSIDKKKKDLADMMSQILSRSIDEEVQAASLIAEREFAVRAAEEELKAAEIALITARAGSSMGDLVGKWENGEDVDEEMEREESAKAATVAAIAGTLANLPFLLTVKEAGMGPLLTIGGVIVSCALFGVTYRYIMRRDLGNLQLKLGAASAFAIVRGIGQLDAVQRLVGLSVATTSDVALIAFNATEGVFTFGFSVLALDYCMKEGLLSPFPSRNS